MKWIVLFFLIFILLAIFARRYRSQIKTAIEIWQSLKVNHQNKHQQRNEMSDNSMNVPLVKCAKCGNWISQTNALNLNQRTFYCSSNCMEKSAVPN